MYGEFAYIYDTMMKDVDYPAWVDYIEKIFHLYKVEPKKIIDLACGTGNITLLLAKRGYEVVGVDISEDMLTMAQEKAGNLGLKIPFIWQDMRDIDLCKGMDAVLIMCDGVNYVLEDHDLRNMFSKVYDILVPGGVLIFDISSYYKLSTILGNNLMADNDEDIALIWENFFNQSNSILTMELTFFVREGLSYRRFDELHIQRAYPTKELDAILRHGGFSDIDYFGDFTLLGPKVEAERIFFVARKGH